MAGHSVTGDQYFEIDGKLLEIKRQLRQPNGYPYDLAALNVLLQDAIEGKLGPRIVLPALVLGQTFRLCVNFGEAFEDMIAAGKYDHRHGIHADVFRIEGSGVVEFEGQLVGISRQASTKEVTKEIESIDLDNPWAPAGIEHLLAFGAKFPDEQIRSKIVALAKIPGVGPRVRQHAVPYLRTSTGKDRWLSGHWSHFGWYPEDRFLAVRKIKG